MTAVDQILARLDGVRERGLGRWIALCPAHEDRSPSLSIRELDDGIVLLHDFAGCSPFEIIDSIGLKYSDLFPNRGIRRVDRRARGVPRLSASDALTALEIEVHVVAIIASDMLGSREIDDRTWERLATAAARIGSARSLCGWDRRT